MIIIYIYIYIKDAIDLSRKLRIALPIRAIAFTLFSGTWNHRHLSGQQNTFKITYKITGWWFQTFCIFPYIENNHPNWLAYFSEGLKPPTRLSNNCIICIIIFWRCWWSVDVFGHVGSFAILEKPGSPVSLRFWLGHSCSIGSVRSSCAEARAGTLRGHRPTSDKWLDHNIYIIYTYT